MKYAKIFIILSAWALFVFACRQWLNFDIVIYAIVVSPISFAVGWKIMQLIDDE